MPDAGTWDGANEQLSRVIDVHSLHLAGNGAQPAGAGIDTTSRPQSDPAGRCCMETPLNAAEECVRPSIKVHRDVMPVLNSTVTVPNVVITGAVMAVRADWSIPTK